MEQALPNTIPPPIPANTHDPLRHDDFILWLVEGKRGDRCVWHEGHLIWQRGCGRQPEPSELEKAKSLNLYADYVWQQAESGRISLTQKKLGPFHYLYIAEIN